MYVRLIRFSFGPGMRAEAQALADDLVPKISVQPGCEGVTAFGEATEGEYGLFVLWDSQASADAAAIVIGPQLSEHLAGNTIGLPDIRLFEVLST